MRKALATALLLAVGGMFLPGCGVSNTDKLTGPIWYLVSGTEKNPSWQWTVPPEAQDRYTIRFENEGTFSSQADCNQLAGAWEVNGSDRVTITPGPMTMAFCGELSLDVLYAGLLGQVRSWNVASTGMSLTLADGGRLDYTSVAPPSPSPSTDATPEPTVSPTPTPAPTTAAPTIAPTPRPSTTRPTSQPTATVTATATATATATVTAPSTPTPTKAPEPTPTPTATPGPGLTTRSWQLAGFALKVPTFAGTVPQDQQARYTIQLLADGTFTAQADCNTITGTYAPADPSGSTGSLSLVPGPTSLKACDEGSYGDLYITGISNTASFAINDELLTLTLVDSGTLEYR